MQIEQFDTGLKTKTNIKDIILLPEQNLRNKNLIRDYLNQIVNLGLKEIDKSLDKAFINDVKVNCFHFFVFYYSRIYFLVIVLAYNYQIL